MELLLQSSGKKKKKDFLTQSSAASVPGVSGIHEELLEDNEEFMSLPLEDNEEFMLCLHMLGR